MGEMGNAYGVFVGNSEGEGSFGIPRRIWRIILNWILKMYGLRVWTESSGLWQDTVAGCWEIGHERLSSKNMEDLWLVERLIFSRTPLHEVGCIVVSGRDSFIYMYICTYCNIHTCVYICI
jgi:hypothetical protein